MFTRNECSRTVRLLWDYLKANLSENEQARIEAHLQQCNSCRKQAEEYRLTANLMDSYRSQPLPAREDDWLKLREQLAAVPGVQPAPKSYRWAPTFALGGLAAAACLCWAFVHFNAAKPMDTAFIPPTTKPTHVDAPLIASISKKAEPTLIPTISHTAQAKTHPKLIEEGRDRTAYTTLASRRRNRHTPILKKLTIPRVAWKEESVSGYQASVIRRAVVAQMNAETGTVRLIPVAVASPISSEDEWNNPEMMHTSYQNQNERNSTGDSER